MGNYFRTLLVIGDDHEAIAAKYSADTKVEPYIKYRLEDQDKIKESRLKVFEKCVENAKKIYEETQDEKKKAEAKLVYHAWNDTFEEYKDKDSFDIYKKLTEGCWYDDNGDAWTDENPEAHYQYQKCYDRRIKANQDDEAPFSNPFILKDGSKAYSTKVKDIDWDMVHMANTELYYSAWQVCVENKEPETEDEKLIKNSFSNRKEYFSNFKNADEYVAHSCAFWTYGIAKENEYLSGDKEDSIKWTTTFYDRFIKPLDGDTLLTIYEIKLLT